MITDHESRPSEFLLPCALENNRHDGLLGFSGKMVPNDMAICFDIAGFFELDHFDQYFHLILWLKVNNDTVFEASILEYDRCESPLGPRSCHRHLELLTEPEN